MTRVAAIGVSIEVPGGWESEIDGGAGRQSGVSTADLMARLHVANFALPEVRGDFGSGATERMRRGEVFLCLLEEDPAMASTRLYANRGVPLLTVADFSPNQMQRPIAGQSGCQAFFHVGSTDEDSPAGRVRAFVLYVVVGDHFGRATVLGDINAMLSSLRFE